MAKIQSVEPNVTDLANGWLKSYKLDYKLEQESLNTEIDQALNDYYSKNGGVGGNRPDAKLLLQDKNLVNYPILIEYKGYKDNALICVLVLFVLVSIPFTTAKSKDNNMMDSSESSISYSETIIIPDSIGVTDVSNCIIQDREARNSIEDGTIYSFVNTNKNYYVQYKCFGSEIIVEKLFCFDKVING